MVLSTILLIIFGTIYLWYTWNRSIETQSKMALTYAQISENGLNGEMFKQLHGTSDDIETTAYVSLKKRLISLLEIIDEVSFAYIYTERDGKLYFMVDSEPEGSEDLAPAGMEYVISGTEYAKPFSDGLAIITKPATDEWGTWISALGLVHLYQ